MVDLRKLRGSYIKLFEYLENDTFPNLKSKGLSSQAFVVSDDLITTHVTRKLMDVFKRLKIEAKIFTDLEDARAWLAGETNKN